MSDSQPLKCLRCDVDLQFFAERNLGYGLHFTKVDMYICPKCRHLELFKPQPATPLQAAFEERYEIP